MNGEYRTLANQSFESNILFYGQENCPPNYFYRGNNIRHNYVLHYIERGKGSFTSADHHVTQLQAGDVFLLPKGVPCFYQADANNPWSYIWLGFSGTKIKPMLLGSSLVQRNYLRQVQTTQFAHYFRRLFNQVHNSTSLVHDILIEGLLYFTFYYLLKEFPSQENRKKTNARQEISLALTYLQQNYHHADCTIRSMCHHLDLSRSYLYTLFRQELGLSPQKYLTHLRMEEAKNLLQTSNQEVQQIALNAGYGDAFTFSKAFKRYSGLSPKIYRQHFQR